jgi:hypothetical protein
MADVLLRRQWDDRCMSGANSRKRLVVAGVVIGIVSAGAAIGVARADEQPKRVTGVSAVLDVMKTGNQLGAAEAYALALSAAGSAVPAKGMFGPADPAVQQGTQQAVIVAGSQGNTVTQVTAAGDSGITQTQNAVQPLAALNAPANQAIEAGAGAMDSAATALHQQTQPLDTTVKQGAQLARQLEAPPGG